MESQIDMLTHANSCVCAACAAAYRPPVDHAPSTSTDASYGITTCPECGTSSTAPVPSEAAVANYYAKSFDYRWYQDHLWAKRRDANIRVREIKQWWPEITAGRMLDFGGGLGYQTQAFIDFGITCVTWDPYAPGRRSPAPSGIDTVVCLHVLEHSIVPQATVEAIRSCLRQDGHLVIAVPNRDGSGYTRHGMNWVWAQPPICHIHHFSEAGLVSLLEHCGFKILDIRRCDRWDANPLSDDKFRHLFVFMGNLWGATPLLSRLPFYRYAIATVTSALRFICLSLLRRKKHQGDAELLIHAVRCN